MNVMKIQVDHYFDGLSLHDNGPYIIVIENDTYRTIARGTDPTADQHASFLMPTAVESHAHLFLDGDELDPAKRSDYLKLPREQLLECGRSNVERYRQAGITVIRDAGDVHGINHELRNLFAGSGMQIISAGSGLRKAKRYGSFFANEIEAYESPTVAVKTLAKDSDEIKIVLTGIIDFENGVVKGLPQFTPQEATEIVNTAHGLGLKTFAHCSGLEGLRVAVEAGVDSIEHGFFMTREILDIMAAKQIAWTPTLLPVYFHQMHPEYCGWSANAVDRLKSILDNHAAMLVQAESMGIDILAGSDAGSYGVRHADGLFTEMALLRQTGLRVETVLRSTTTTPRAHLGLPPLTVAPGNVAEFILHNMSVDALLNNLNV